MVLGTVDVNGLPSRRPDLPGHLNLILRHRLKEHGLLPIQPETLSRPLPHGTDLLKVRHRGTSRVMDGSSGLHELFVGLDDHRTHLTTIPRVDEDRSHRRGISLADHGHVAELKLLVVLVTHGEPDLLSLGIRLPPSVLEGIPIGESPLKEAAAIKGNLIGFLEHTQRRLKLGRDRHQGAVVALGDRTRLFHGKLPILQVGEVDDVVLVEPTLGQRLKGVGDVHPIHVEVLELILTGISQDQATSKALGGCTIANAEDKELTRLTIQEVGIGIPVHKVLGHLSRCGIQILLGTTREVGQDRQVTATQLQRIVLEARASLVLLDNVRRLSRCHEIMESQGSSVGADRLLALKSKRIGKGKARSSHNQLVVGHVNSVLVVEDVGNLVDCSLVLHLELGGKVNQTALGIVALRRQGIHTLVVSTLIGDRSLADKLPIRILGKVLLDSSHHGADLVALPISIHVFPVRTVVLNELENTRLHLVTHSLKDVQHLALELRQDGIGHPVLTLAEDLGHGLGTTNEHDVLAALLVTDLGDVELARVDDVLEHVLCLERIIAEASSEVDRHVDPHGRSDACGDGSDKGIKVLHVEPIQSGDCAPLCQCDLNPRSLRVDCYKAAVIG